MLQKSILIFPGGLFLPARSRFGKAGAASPRPTPARAAGAAPGFPLLSLPQAPVMK